ncbi:hypothetical protein BCON_0253g00050 [Botryotinia convoluta]|uniref:Uncharacterized protein n=1 Tax=Botryotinia convoluta TaxID=54673 RepID=A0A4Z1HG41_9HELO|nr:hypothetical protein BCON_0253g00050 [Botryotinia convoluta]
MSTTDVSSDSRRSDRTHRTHRSHRSGDSRPSNASRNLHEVFLDPITKMAVEVTYKNGKRIEPIPSDDSKPGDDQSSEYSAASSANTDSTVKPKKKNRGNGSLHTIDEHEHEHDNNDRRLVLRSRKLEEDGSRGGSRRAPSTVPSTSSNRTGSNAYSQRTSTHRSRAPTQIEKEVKPDDSISNVSAKTYSTRTKSSRSGSTSVSDFPRPPPSQVSRTDSDGKGSLYASDMRRVAQHHAAPPLKYREPTRPPPSERGGSVSAAQPYPSSGGQVGYGGPPSAHGDINRYPPRPRTTAVTSGGHWSSSFVQDGQGRSVQMHSSSFFASRTG